MQPQALLTTILLFGGALLLAFTISSTIQVLGLAALRRQRWRWQILLGFQICMCVGYLVLGGLDVEQPALLSPLESAVAFGVALVLWLTTRLSAASLAELSDSYGAAQSAGVSRSIWLANLSHKLRTPLTEIIGYSSLLIEEGQSEPDHDLWRIRAAGTRLLSLITAILDHALLEAGRLELAPRPVALPALLEDVLTAVRPLATRQQNQLELSVAANLPPLVADEARLRQILVSLLSNACTYTRQGLVSLCVSQVKGALHFTVIDTGVGISRAQQSLLFQPFAQATAHTVPRYGGNGGSGLGLSIARELARLMGGELSVDSTPGRGSAFTLSLPVSVVETRAELTESLCVSQ